MEETINSDQKTAGAGTANEVVRAAAAQAAKEWGTFVKGLEPIAERVVPLMTDPQDPHLRQELYRLMVSELSMAYFAQFLGDARNPDFWPLLNQAFNVWGPNPDMYYYHVPIEGTGTYKISGFRGTVRILDFQVGPGQLYNDGTMGPVGATANYDPDDLEIDENGYFEVLLSAERPAGYTGNWWKIYPDTTNVHVRQIAYDWLNEVDSRFMIERLDTPAARPRLSAEEIAERMARLPGFVENMTATALEQIRGERESTPVNTVVITDAATTGGAKAQRYVLGQFDIEEDEALILETNVPECKYWSFVLNDMTYSVLDYTNRHSSLNGFQAKLDSDGRFRAVISAVDPGVPNWLDTVSYKRGVIIGRWREAVSAPLPTLTKVKVADVRKHLPADTPVETPAMREAVIRLRSKGARMRRRW